MYEWIHAHWNIVSWITGISTLASTLHTFLPPWDWKSKFVDESLVEFPTAQKLFYTVFHNRYYRLLIYVCGYLAIAQRSNVWRFISVKNPTGPNANVPTVIHAANVQLDKQEGQ